MDQAVRNVMIEAVRASDEERITFPEVVAALKAAGVERYHADLTRGERTFHTCQGDSETVAAHKPEAAPAAQFAGRDIEAAIRAIQAGAIRYREFCTRILRAGCVGYHVFIDGRRALYYGRHGDIHVEWFPGARP